MNELEIVDGKPLEEAILEDWVITRPIPAQSSMTPAVVRNILALIAGGNYVLQSCLASGVSRRTYYTWQEKAQEQPDSCYGEFARLVEKAYAAAETANIRIIAKAAPQSWQAAAWLLERKFPDRYGQRNTTVLDGDLTIGIGAAGLIKAMREGANETTDE